MKVAGEAVRGEVTGGGGQGTEREVTAVPCRHLGRVSRPQAQVVPRPLGGRSF